MRTNEMKTNLHYSKVEALDFFERLAAYSAEYVRRAIQKIHKHWPSRNHYDNWSGVDEEPRGHLFHYTAGTSFAGTIRHFTLGHRASANFVVAKALDRRFDELRRDLKLAGDLSAEAVQVVAPTKPAWSGGWVNRFLASTEARNAGVLRPYPKKLGDPPSRAMSRAAFFEYASWDVDDLDFYWWPGGWTAKFRGEVLLVNGSWWESWSRGQLATIVTLLRYVNALYDGSFDPTWMLAHHQTNAGKNDVVLPVDLDQLRRAILWSTEHVDDLEWLAAYDDCEDGFEDLDDPWMLRELDEAQGDRGEEDLDDYEDLIEGRVDEASETGEALRRLGYHVATPEALVRSVRIYQRSRDLRVDGDAGPDTRGRLTRDLREWRIG